MLEPTVRLLVPPFVVDLWQASLDRVCLTSDVVHLGDKTAVLRESPTLEQTAGNKDRAESCSRWQVKYRPLALGKARGRGTRAECLKAYASHEHTMPQPSNAVQPTALWSQHLEKFFSPFLAISRAPIHSRCQPSSAEIPRHRLYLRCSMCGPRGSLCCSTPS